MKQGALETELAAAVGDSHVLADAERRAGFETDWTRRFVGSCRAVVRPRDTGEVRAVGDVLREQAFYMVRVGFDAFEFADGTGPDDLAHVAARYRDVYQTSSDRRQPIFTERDRGAPDA